MPDHSTNRDRCHDRKRMHWFDHGESNRLIIGEPFHRTWSGAAGLSFKHYIGGNVPFRVSRHSFGVDSQHYVLVNSGQPYEFDTTQNGPLLNFTWFFDPIELGNAWHAATTSEDALLDDPEGTIHPPEFVACPWRIPPNVILLRENLYDSWHGNRMSHTSIGEALPIIIASVIDDQLKARGEMRRLSSKRDATRREIFVRIKRTTDFVRESLGCNLSLSTLAQVAQMSKYHFSHCFQEMLKVSPRQYVLQRRMAKAAELIKSGKFSVSQIARICGYKQLSVFSRAFKRTFGVSPKNLRKA